MLRHRVYNWVLNGVSVACLAFLVWRLLYSSPSVPPPDLTGLVGTEFRLAGVQWGQSPRTVILALSPTCPACKMSSGFYRALIDSARPEDFRVIAVSQVSADALRPYVVELGIEKSKDLYQAALRPLGVRLTPTLVIVDSHGKVESAWAGRLSGSQEREVFAALRTGLPAQVGEVNSSRDSVAVVEVGTEELRILLKDPDTVVLDVRERSLFYEAHLPNSLNMPVDEIAPRAPHELPNDREILVYAHIGQSCSGLKNPLSAPFFKGVIGVLRHEGFTKVRFVADDLAALARAGIRVEGKPCP